MCAITILSTQCYWHAKEYKLVFMHEMKAYEASFHLVYVIYSKISKTENFCSVHNFSLNGELFPTNYGLLAII